MGACNCREEDRIEYANLNISNKKTKMNVKTLIESASNKSVKIVRNTPYPETRYQDTFEYAPAHNFYDSKKPEETKAEIIVNSTPEQEEKPIIQNISIKLDSHREETTTPNHEEIKEKSATEDSFASIQEISKQEKSIVLTFEQEYEYNEFSNNVFNYFNNLRHSPEKYTNDVHPSKIIYLF